MTPSLLAALFQGLANFAVLFLVIMYLQGPRGLSPIHASLLLVPGYVVGIGRRPVRRAPGGPLGPGPAGHGRAVPTGRRPAPLRPAFARHRAVAGRAGQRPERRRRERLLPRQHRP